MKYRVSDITGEIERHFPRGYAMEWDNPGLLVGRSDREVKRILIALDATKEIIDRAAELKADMVLTHHPLIFRAIKSVSDGSVIGNKLLSLIENGISLYSMHTNYDIAQGGMAAAVAERLELKMIAPLEITAEEDGEPVGIGFVAELEEELTAREFAEEVKKVFGLDAVALYDAGGAVRKIAVCPGSGGGMLKEAIATGCDVLLTGDMGHHDGIDAVDAGISLVDAGHFGLEKVFVEELTDFIREHFEGIEIIKDEKAYRQMI